MCVCVCSFVWHVCNGTYVCMHALTCGADGQKCLMSSSVLHIIFLRQCVSLNLEFTNPSRLARPAKGPSCFCLPSPEISGIHHIQLFMYVVGIQIQVLMHLCQVLYQVSHLLSSKSGSLS